MMILHFESPPVLLSAGRAAAWVHHAGGLSWIDYLMIAVYLGSMLTVGWYYGRRESDSEDYFIAARKHVHPILIGISMFAALLSTISYLGKPGEMINKGPFLLIGQAVSVPFAYAIVGYLIIPKLMRQRVTSAYELLEQRLGLGVRLLGSIMFIGLRLIWMAMLIYLASQAICVIIGLDVKWMATVAVIVGMVAVLYTSVGGFRTVVTADVVQFCLMLTGALVTIGLITWTLKGFSWIPTHWSTRWDRQPWISFDPHVRVSVFTAALSMLVWRVSTAGGDQTAVQRYMATKDIRAARRSYLITESITLVVTVILALLGLALLGYFSRPGALPAGMTIAANGDDLFPYFIAHELPVGLSGLVVAALIASMSNVDTGVSSVSAVVMTDFVERAGLSPGSEKGALLFSRILAFSIGTVVVIGSTFMQHVSGNFVEKASKTANLLVSPIFGLFVLALWVPRATPLAATVGCAFGLATAVLIGFWDELTGREAVSFLWMGPGSLLVDVAIGLLVCWIGPRRENRGVTWLVGAGSAVVLGLVVTLALNG